MSDTLEAKERAEMLRGLVEGSFKRRNELEALEWKMNFSLWTGIILAGWALHNKPETQHLHWWALCFLLVLPIQAYFVHVFARSEQRAVDFAFKYLKELELLIGFKEEKERPSAIISRPKLSQWYFLEIGPTLLLIVAAIALVW